MFIKGSLLTAIAFLQVNVVLSQQEQQEQKPQQQPGGLLNQQDIIQGMTPAQMWNPFSWITPYYAAASDAWADYLKKAQEASNQLYQQWDKTGAGNIFNFGTGLAQQTANQTQQGAQEAANQTQQATQEAVNQTQKGAETGSDAAQKVPS